MTTKTTYKVGDKVRILKASAIIGGTEHWSDGDITEVSEIKKVGAEEKVFLRRIKTERTARSPFLHKSELKYIEKVAEQVAKFKVGDKVRATKASNAEYAFTTERNGWTGVITTVNPSGHFRADSITPEGEGSYGGLDPKYFELISQKPTKNQRITTLEQEVEALKAEVEALKAAQKPTISIGGGTLVISKETDTSDIASKLAETIAKSTERSPRKKMTLTPNEQRKAIIAEAKAFVEKVEAQLYSIKADRTQGNYTYQETSGYVKYNVNAEKRAVTALVYDKYCDKLRERAVAKCAPTDVFNADIGKAIALGRALGLDVKRFEQAVQPTEVVVGQTFKVTQQGRVTGIVAKITRMLPDLDGIYGKAFGHTYDGGWLGEAQVTIIDDTGAQY